LTVLHLLPAGLVARENDAVSGTYFFTGFIRCQATVKVCMFKGLHKTALAHPDTMQYVYTAYAGHRGQGLQLTHGAGQPKK
jgi:hypothetical protein